MERMKVGDKVYSKTSCHATEKSAKDEADKQRKAGKLARVAKDPESGKNCVFTRNKTGVNGKSSKKRSTTAAKKK